MPQIENFRLKNQLIGSLRLLLAIPGLGNVTNIYYWAIIASV